MAFPNGVNITVVELVPEIINIPPDVPFSVVVNQVLPFNVVVSNERGPVGPQGPPGSPGAAGLVGIATVSGVIPVGQIFTLVDGSGVVTLTLPAISSVMVGSLTQAYNIKNLTANQVIIAGAGVDQVEFDTSLTIRFQNESVTLLATADGWVVI